MIKEISSGFYNLSFTIYWSNVESILKKYTKSKALLKRIQESFISFTTEEVIKDLYNGSYNRSVIRLLLTYNKLNTGFEAELLRDYIFCLKSSALKDIAKFKLEKTTFLTYNLYVEPLLKETSQSKDYVESRVIEYAMAFYYFSLLTIVFSAIHHFIDNTKFENFCYEVHNKLRLGILTGFEAFTEVETDFLYSLFAEELLALETADPKRLAISKSELQTLEYTIKNNIILQEAY